MTHEAPFGVLDMTGGGHWGSSHDLLEAIYRVKPKVHLFGHIHEQRGHWDKAARREFGSSERLMDLKCWKLEGPMVNKSDLFDIPSLIWD